MTEKQVPTARETARADVRALGPAIGASRGRLGSWLSRALATLVGRSGLKEHAHAGSYETILSGKHIEAIHALSRGLQQVQAPSEMAKQVIEVLEEQLGYDYGAVLLVDPVEKSLIPIALSGQGKGAEFVALDKQYVASHQLKVGEGITGWVAKHGESVVASDVRRDARYHEMRPDIRSELCVPMRVDGRTIGVINIETTRENAYGQLDQVIMEVVAAQLAVMLLAAEDPVTGVCNRRCLESLAEHEFVRARRFKRPLTVALFDCNDFKRINDTFGHAAGDRVLRRVAETVVALVRDIDVFGRLGGDEFALLLPETGREEGLHVVARLQAAFEAQSIEFGGELIPFTVSVGVASRDETHRDWAALLAAADRDMFLAKAAWRASSPPEGGPGVPTTSDSS